PRAGVVTDRAVVAQGGHERSLWSARIIGVQSDVMALEVEEGSVTLNVDLVLERSDERHPVVVPGPGVEEEGADRVWPGIRGAVQGEAGIAGPERDHQVDVLVALGPVERGLQLVDLSDLLAFGVRRCQGGESQGADSDERRSCHTLAQQIA